MAPAPLTGVGGEPEALGRVFAEEVEWRVCELKC